MLSARRLSTNGKRRAFVDGDRDIYGKVALLYKVINSAVLSTLFMLLHNSNYSILLRRVNMASAFTVKIFNRTVSILATVPAYAHNTYCDRTQHDKSAHRSREHDSI